ncbi:trehalose-6-phosphate synthase [Desulfocurvibacter africanus]|uniref:Alpha,alpha-trehalose-phosphate synthase (UDP-forming) n=1 Tax=Desulfocurvibacter africanus subsp. africanus str. Walvis Bay TaxID=690850 RepID=F3Z2Z7_DESAF|nr:trehalose-6-phosphate synthase [Desulfocurvibacter africanus]EGJ51405.1 Alpha,alpha-trehalose-phosphate synthase (UDP-forming) [Desulfocurvibacter africanus subsp. africanus str. Walvis Bay]
MEGGSKRLVVVSNRLPVALSNEGGRWVIKPGGGGLVTALAPVLKNRGGLWIGWSGAKGEVDIVDPLAEFSREAGYSLHPVYLTEEEVAGYYHGFSNEVIWPLFHDFQSRCNFNPTYWRSYLDANLKFAEVVVRFSRDSDYIWVHDYHLMHLAFMLRNMGVPRSCGFFLHIPFPPPDIFLKLPWRAKIVRSLLEYDLVGFQTGRDRSNFISCLRALLPEASISGRGNEVRVTLLGRTSRLGAFPISIDFNAFANMASSGEVAQKTKDFRDALRQRKILLGVDRLDYTKGIPQRIEAIRQLLIKFPDLRERFSFVQLAVPSREEIPEYNALKIEIERLVGEVNGQFAQPGWVPIQYLYRSLPRADLVAYYRAADIALVTPLRDGMNLVAKEYCASNVSETGVLILSEFAGAAGQLQKNGAKLVNPHDVEGVAKVIHKAFHTDIADHRRNMHRLRDSIRKADIFWWVDSFLQNAFSRHLNDFPPLEGVSFHS